MYTDKNCKILKKDFAAPYVRAFQQYSITSIYGKEMVMGSEIEND